MNDEYPFLYPQQDPTQRVSQSGYDYDYSYGDVLIPPPPSLPPAPKRSHWWRWAAGVLALLLLGNGLLVGYLLGSRPAGQTSPSLSAATPTAPLAPTPTPTFRPTPTLAPTPPYVSDLSSSDPNVFARALGEALQAYDATNILPYVLTTQFFIICDEGNGFQGQCDTSWAQVSEQITSQKLLIDILTQGLILVNSAYLSSYCTGLGGRSSSDILAIGSFEQETDMPLSHIGGVVLGISSSGGSALHPAYAWSELYFC